MGRARTSQKQLAAAEHTVICLPRQSLALYKAIIS